MINKFAVIVFPGSNCDHDAYHVLKDTFNIDVDFIWHRDSNLKNYDAILIPGGFSYGDYLRTGAIARFFVPGSGLYGLVVTTVLGVVGALVGGFIGAQLGIGAVNGFDLRSIAIAVGGSIIVLLGYRAIGSRSR